MLVFASQEEIDRFNKLEFRLLTAKDFPSYIEAFKESHDHISTYMNINEPTHPSFKVLQDEYMSDLRNRNFDMYGLFEGKRLIGVGTYFYLEYSPNGCQIIIWIRKSEHGKKYGTMFLRRLTLFALYDKYFRFVELVIDETNLRSQNMAKNVGYEFMEKIETNTQGTLGSGVYYRFILFDGELESLAENYHRQPIDLIDHPAYDRYYRKLIHDEAINSYLAWPWPIENRREYEGEPFGLVLDQLMEQAEEEELMLEKYQEELMKSDLFKDRKMKSKLRLLWSK